MSTRPARRKAAPVCAPPPRLALEALEDRRVPAGIPALHSLPSAPVAVYLDFDGGFSSRTGVTYAPYDTDGNPGDYSAAEVAAITELHRQISVYFAMFNVDVTTVFDARPKAWHISSPTVSGGFAYVNTFPNNQPEGFNQQGDVTNRASGIAHEVGHIFGLGHVRDYDLLGNEINEYSSGFDALHGPLMGVDFAGSIHKFVIARSGSVTAFQDDIAVIAADLDNYGGDGFRPDDFGNTTGAATAVSFGQTVTGIIERLNDADAFSFTTGGGPVRVRATRVAPSGVDLKVQVFNSAGALIAEADPFTGTGTAANNVDITLQLAAGTYFALVSSHGDYGDVGTYTFNVSTGTAVSPPTFNGLSPPTGVALVLAATGTGITVSWNAVAGASGYTVRRSEDGVTYTTAGTTSGTSFTDNGPSASRRWFYQVQANSGSTVSTPSAAANIVNRPAAPFNLTVTRVSGGTTVALNWRDVAGDTGYRIERSTDGTNWTQVGTVGRNVPGFTNTGLNASTTYLYRVFATSPQGDSRASAVAATNNALAVHTTSVTGTSVSLRWSPVVRSRYDIERSTDGVNFTLLATQTGTTYTDSTVTGGVTYTYRVKAEDTSNGSDNSPPSVLTVAIGGVSNAPPVLTPPANQTVPSTQATVTVPLAASDPDGDPVTFAATAVSLAHRLDVTLGYNFFSDGNFFQNFLGRNERWVQTALVPAGWAFVEPDGELFAWDGGTSGALVGNVGAHYYADPTRLVNVPTTPFATLAVSGSTLTVTRTPAATASSIYVTVTASDGRGGTDTEAFTVTVTAGGASNAPPVLTPPANQTVPSTQATVTVPLAASDPDGDPVTFAA
ncbi:MAG: hypothetical protein C0501_18070, partial [Isosphaera sp.]|nr:hypothetical protein [Isosphaera sp.]